METRCRARLSDANALGSGRPGLFLDLERLSEALHAHALYLCRNRMNCGVPRFV